VRAVELFAGAGGAALGLEQAGIEHAALCEWDPSACATMRAAGLGPVVEGDVRDLDAIEAVAGPGPIDLLWSSFPCQAFSTAGKRLGASDERNGWPWTVDAIDRFKPRWFLGENVPGLAQHHAQCDGEGETDSCNGCYLDRVIVSDLRQRFPCVGWFILSADWYGVPQARRRLFLWAGDAPIEPPTRLSGSARVDLVVDPYLCPDCGGTREISTRLFGAVPCASCDDEGVWRPFCGRPVSIVSTGRAGGGSARGLLQPAPTISGKATAMFVAVPPGADIPPDAPGRQLSVSESAALQGFPNGYPFQGTKTAQYRQVGNAVPPTLARVVAERVIEADERL
jgi:DNA (cytosine-5)-methyltransferase 1